MMIACVVIDVNVVVAIDVNKAAILDTVICVVDIVGVIDVVMMSVM